MSQSDTRIPVPDFLELKRMGFISRVGRTYLKFSWA